MFNHLLLPYKHLRVPRQTSSRIARFGSSLCKAQQVSKPCEGSKGAQAYWEHHNHFSRTLDDNCKVETDLEAFEGFMNDNVLYLSRGYERSSRIEKEIRRRC